MKEVEKLDGEVRKRGRGRAQFRTAAGHRYGD